VRREEERSLAPRALASRRLGPAGILRDGSLEQLQVDLDAWLREYNAGRLHQGRWCYGKTPMQTFLDTVPVVGEKLLPVA